MSANLGSVGQGLSAGIINGTITIPGLGVISNLGLLVRALAADAKANILSTPTLLTLDNEEARIIVGQNVPFITGQYATTGSSSTVQPFTTVERRDVGILLRVRPQITEGGTVRLVLYQEVSRVQETATSGSTPARQPRSDAVEALAGIVGGRRRQADHRAGRADPGHARPTADKIPYAGDMPVLGPLFRYDTRTRQKTNLMIFIKPTVIRNDAEGRQLTSERYDYLRGAQQDARPEPKPLFGPIRTFPTCRRQPTMPGIPAQPPLPTMTPQPAPAPPSFPARRRRAGAVALARRPEPGDAPSPPQRSSPPSCARARGFRTRSRRRTACWRMAEDGDAVVVLLRPDATVDGIAELNRVLAQPLLTRAVDADAFAAELARAYNQATRRRTSGRRPRRATTDLARLMQELPPAEDLLDAATQAPVIRMINALLLQALRERASDLHFEPYESRSVVRFRVDGVLARRHRAAARAARGARVAAQDHGEPRHRGEAAAAGRPHRAEARRQAGRRARVDAADRRGRARRAAAARQGLGAARSRRARHERRRRSRRSIA